MNGRTVQILIDYVLTLVCAVIGIRIWAFLTTAFEWLIPIPHPYLIAAAFLAIYPSG